MAAKKTRRSRKKKASRKTGSKKPSPAFAFIEDKLRKDKNASYQEIRDAAAKKGLDIAPILYGRVKALLGLVPMKKRGSKKKAGRRKATAARTTQRTGRGPGRPRKTATYDGVVGAIAELQRERDEMQDVLVKIQDLLERVV